jgi:hypothetical protein
VHQLAIGTAECPAARLRGIARQRQAVVLQQILRMPRRAAPRQIAGRGHAQAAVVRQPQADQRGIDQVAHAHGAVQALARQVDHPVGEVQRD